MNGGPVGMIVLPESTGTLLAAVCHVQVSHSPPPPSDVATRPGHVTVHTHSRAIGGSDPVVARGGGGRERSTVIYCHCEVALTGNIHILLH